MSKTAIVLGKGTLAIRIAEWFRTAGEWDLLAVVPVVPEPDWTRSLAGWARRRDVPLVASGRAMDAVRLIRSGRADPPYADLAFSVFYDRILTPAFLAAFGRALNLHNSALPRYRGVAPINWALKNEERSHGVTIHEITPGIDDGPIVAQTTFSIYPEFDEVIDVYRRALEYGWLTFLQSMPIIDRIAARPQDGQASYYSKADAAFLGERGAFTMAEARGTSPSRRRHRLRA